MNERGVENHPEMFSVFDTLKETLFLWRRNFWYFAVIALLFVPPNVLLDQLHYIASSSHSFGSPLVAFIVSSAQLLLDTANIAVLFGLLKKGPTESAWKATWHGIEIYTGPMFRLILLIGLIIGIPLAAIKAVVIHWTGSEKAEMLLQPGFYLVFFLCALAFPLVVEEKLGAVVALKRCWEMAKKHFLYVEGCCLIPGLGEWLIRRMMRLPVDTTNEKISWPGVSNGFISGLLGSAWVILFWSMCLRIKAVEVQSPSEATSN